MIIRLGGLGRIQIAVACRGTALKEVARQFNGFGIGKRSLIIGPCPSETHLIKINSGIKRKEIHPAIHSLII